MVKKDEALKTCLEMFREIRGDWTDPRMECRAGADAAVAALALTPADCAGMECVPTGELAELRRDKERRIEALESLYDIAVQDFTELRSGKRTVTAIRAAIDAARRAGGNAT